MCGICGIVDFKQAVSKDILWSMVETIKHRGPDDAGVEMVDNAVLGQARLSIIDLSSAGHQPMQSADKKVTLVYNGEIYNFRELREELEKEGTVFRGHSDTEVVLQAYRHWGTKSFLRFNGMFSFAIWDQDIKQLYLVRDRFGIKPLYYFVVEDSIVFASEVKAILASGKVSKSLDYGALHEYLWFGAALGESSLFAGVRKLLPGHYLTFSQDKISSASYWSPEQVKPNKDNLSQAITTVRDKLEQAVKDHLISDVPVGVFLSGGIDSSAITAFASKHYNEKLQTFSVGFDFEQGPNELPKAKQIATLFDTDHHELHVIGGDLKNVIESLVGYHDEPFADAADIPLFLLCQQLKGSIKVILQGDGGDEIFAGYRRYNVMSYEKFWHYASKIAVLAQKLLPKTADFYRRSRFFCAMSQNDPALRTALLLTVESIREPPTRIFSEHFRRQLLQHDPFKRYREVYNELQHLDSVQRLLYTDCSIHLPDLFLEKVDKSTMANSIEVRVPFLDKNLTEYAMGLPANYKVRNSQKKWILRQALRGVIPDNILDGSKTGFSVPFEYWLRKPLAEYMRSVLLDSAIINANLFDSAKLKVCMDEHISGKKNNGFLLWKALNLAIWWSKY